MPDIRLLIRSFLNKRGYEIIKKPYLGEPYPHTRQGDADVFKTPIGTYFLPANAPKEGMTYLMSRGKVHDEAVIEVARQWVKPGTAALDLGANFGQMTLLLSDMVGPSGKVYAFEAQRKVYDLLTKTVAANNRTNIEVVYGAVYNESGIELVFPEPDLSDYNPYSANAINPTLKSGPKVVTLTIDSLNIPEPVSFMKVDIQGSDLAALQGARQTILKNRMPIIFEFETEFQAQFNTTFQDYVEFTASIGYRFEAIVLQNNFLIVPND